MDLIKQMCKALLATARGESIFVNKKRKKILLLELVPVCKLVPVCRTHALTHSLTHAHTHAHTHTHTHARTHTHTHARTHTHTHTHTHARTHTHAARVNQFLCEKKVKKSCCLNWCPWATFCKKTFCVKKYFFFFFFE